MPIHKAANVEPIRGYRLIEPIGKGGFGEVWKCEAPGGIFKAIKFVYGDLNGLEANRFRAEEELRAFQLIKSIRHPFLLSIDRVEVVDGELVIVTELADLNLHQLKKLYESKGLPGIPRDELLEFLRETAEVLDLLNEKFDLQHLDVKPRNLFVVSNHVKVADFGLVNSLSANRQAGANLGAITPVYAAPELFQGTISRQCDQYSLAIAYQELATGTFPFVGENYNQLLLQHMQAEPNLAPLAEGERNIVGQALSKQPEKRFRSCREFVRALFGEPSSCVSTESSYDLGQARGSGDTLQGVSSETVRVRTAPAAPTPPVAQQVLPGVQFQECLSTGPLQDVWKASADGRRCLVKLLYGSNAADAQDAILQLKSIHHPALARAEIVHAQPGQLVVVTDAVKETVHDRFHWCQGRKQPGIVRGELMDYLRAAAEVLDYLYQQYGLFHLNLHPKQLIIDRGWLQIAEFGFGQLLWMPAGQDVAARNPRYAAPELFEHRFTRSSDQYSLALIYAEMLTGIHPYHHTGYHAKARLRGQPDLERLPVLDREVIARALDNDPSKRWPNCTEMLLALEGTSLELLKELEAQGDQFSQLIESSRGAPLNAALAGATQENLDQLIEEIITKASGPEIPPCTTQIAPVLQEGVLKHVFQVSLPVGAARTRLEGFPQQWFAEIIRDDDQGLVFRINLTTTFWQQFFGKKAGVEVCLRMARVNPMAVTPIEITTTVQTLRAGHAASENLLEELGPDIIENLRKLLLTDSDKRIQDRLLWPHALRITPIQPDGTHEEAIECRGKDISRSGLGFYLPHELSTSELLIELPNSIHPPSIAVPATLVRAKRCADGWYEVGALFRLPALRKSMPDVDLPALPEAAHV